MIADNQTNTLYIADCLAIKHPVFFECFDQLLKIHDIPVQFLPDCRDIWAVDFMPIQVSTEKFVQFVYNPDYLQSKKGQKSISDVDNICRKLNLNPLKSDIVLDGGNVVKSSDKVILCDKVFLENPNYSRKQLTNKLRELFETDKLFFVPQQPVDFTGHADGMIRFVNNESVIISDFTKEKPEFSRAFKIAIENAGLDYTEIPYNPYCNKKASEANGIYINFLQMKNLLVIPVFGIKEDDIAIRQFEQIFAGQNIVTIDSNEIALFGGILNCISWNILSN